MTLNRLQRTLWLSWAACAFLVTGCGDSTSPGLPVASVTVAPETATVAAEDTLRLQATARDASGEAVAAGPLEWSSTDRSVATVDSTGLVTGVEAGESTITASVQGESGSATITVTPAPVASVTVSPESADLEAGRSLQLFATPRSAAGRALTDRPITWTSADTGIATVDLTGLVRGVEPGTTAVTAASEGVEGTAEITVTPRPLAAVTVRPDTAAILEGTTIQLSAALIDADGDTIRDGRPITWSSSDTGLATVDTTGLVTGRAEGAVTITAMSDGHAGTARVVVDPPTTYAGTDGGVTHTCGRTPADLAYCWGNGTDGQLGNGDLNSQSAPVRVRGGLSFSLVQAGGRHSCGLTTAAEAHCWGYNGSGQLGNGTSGPFLQEPLPVAVEGGLELSVLSTGTNHTCGITTDGTAYCWGENSSGRLGDGSTVDRVAPVPVAGDLSLVSISAGGPHTCGLTASGEAYCWGRNDDGQLGDGTNAQSDTPVAVVGDLDFTGIFLGPRHSCATTSANQAYCWGRNTHGQLGDGSTTAANVPTSVAGNLEFTRLALGFNHSCGITPDGSAHCWGWGERGQLGNGDTADATVPTAVAGDISFRSITTGSFHSCGISTGDIVYCWGDNASGQVGDGGVQTRTSPTRVSGQP